MPQRSDGPVRSASAKSMVLLLLAGWLMGCGAFAGQATEAAVGEGLETLAADQSAADIHDTLTNPRIQAAASEFTRQILDAAADELTSEERLATLRAAFIDFVGALSAELGPELQRIGNGLSSQVVQLARRLGEQMTSLEAQEVAQQYVSGVTHAMVRSAAQGVREELTPAMAGMLRDPAMQAALQESTAALVHGMIVGVDEGLQEREEELDRGGESFIVSRMNRLSERGESIGSRLRWGLYAAIAGFVLTLAILIWQLRKNRRESHRREASMVLLSSAIQSAHDHPISPQLRDALRQHFRHEPGVEYLEEVLRQETEERRAERSESGRAPRSSHEDAA